MSLSVKNKKFEYSCFKLLITWFEIFLDYNVEVISSL
jgi:hypothetical protein